MKIIRNASRNGFIDFSLECLKRYAEEKGFTFESDGGFKTMVDQGGRLVFIDDFRSDPVLISIIEEIGLSAAIGFYCEKMEIVEIPDDVDWEIWKENNGYEFIREKARQW